MTLVPIPPDVIVFGPIEARIPEIVAKITNNVHGTPAHEAGVLGAVQAAMIYVIEFAHRADIGLPDDPLTVHGLVGFSERIYLDAFSPNGAQVSVADASFAPVFQPEHLFKHWRHYFLRLKTAWGVA